MKNTISWCYMHCPKDMIDGNVIDIINVSKEALIDKLLLHKLKMDTLTIKTLSIQELSNAPMSKQYYLIIANILLNDVKTMPIEKVCFLVRWFLDLPSVYELEWVYYLWHESSLCDSSSMPAFGMLIDAAEHAEDAKTMEFLWQVARSGDMYLVMVVKCIAEALEGSSLTKYLAYTYVCSGIDLNVLYRFFSDLYKTNGSDQQLLAKTFYTYLWTTDIMNTLVNKKYTIHRLAKHLNNCAFRTVLYPGREVDVESLPTKVLPTFPPREEPVFHNVPNYNHDYKIDFKLWYRGYWYPNEILGVQSKSIYQSWFESLTKAQLLKFRDSNPIVYKACYEGKFDMVKEVLIKMMKEKEL